MCVHVTLRRVEVHVCVLVCLNVCIVAEKEACMYNKDINGLDQPKQIDTLAVIQLGTDNSHATDRGLGTAK